MKNIYPAKSSFHKLYLIEEEMYNRVLPKLNEVEKQELGDLQETYKPYEDSEEVTPKQNDSALSKPETIVEQMEPEKNKDELTSSLNASNQLQALTTKKTKRKEKKYACEICINKMFTTTRSLKRHNETFHTAKQFIKQNEVPPEITDPTHDSPTKKSAVKRRFSDRYDSPSEEPIQKKVRFDLKRKFPDDYDSPSEEPDQKSLKFSQGIKRKGPERATDYLPRKKFHWASF